MDVDVVGNNWQRCRRCGKERLQGSFPQILRGSRAPSRRALCVSCVRAEVLSSVASIDIPAVLSIDAPPHCHFTCVGIVGWASAAVCSPFGERRSRWSGVRVVDECVGADRAKGAFGCSPERLL